MKIPYMNERFFHIHPQQSKRVYKKDERQRTAGAETQSEYSNVDVVLMFNVFFLFVISEFDEGKILY